MPVLLVNGKIIPERELYLTKGVNCLVSKAKDYLNWFDQIVCYLYTEFPPENKHDLDKELCYLLGCFNSASTKIKMDWRDDKVVFSKGTERLFNVLERLMIKHTTTKKSKVKIHVGVWRDFLKDLCAFKNRIPKEILQGPRENAQAFVDGFMDLEEELPCCRSGEFAQELFDLMNRLGYDIWLDKNRGIKILEKVNEQKMKIVPIQKIY